MAKYTRTINEFYDDLKKSWTWDKMTDAERKDFENLNVLEKLKGTNSQRIDMLNLIYRAYVMGLKLNER